MEEFVVMRYQNGDGKHFSSFFFIFIYTGFRNWVNF